MPRTRTQPFLDGSHVLLSPLRASSAHSSARAPLGIIIFIVLSQRLLSETAERAITSRGPATFYPPHAAYISGPFSSISSSTSPICNLHSVIPLVIGVARGCSGQVGVPEDESINVLTPQDGKIGQTKTKTVFQNDD